MNQLTVFPFHFNFCFIYSGKYSLPIKMIILKNPNILRFIFPFQCSYSIFFTLIKIPFKLSFMYNFDTKTVWLVLIPISCILTITNIIFICAFTMSLIIKPITWIWIPKFIDKTTIAIHSIISPKAFIFLATYP